MPQALNPIYPQNLIILDQWPVFKAFGKNAITSYKKCNSKTRSPAPAIPKKRKEGGFHTDRHTQNLLACALLQGPSTGWSPGCKARLGRLGKQQLEWNSPKVRPILLATPVVGPPAVLVLSCCRFSLAHPHSSMA